VVRIFKPYQTQAVSVNRGFRESGRLQLAPSRPLSHSWREFRTPTSEFPAANLRREMASTARPFQAEMGQPPPAGLFENIMMMEADQTCWRAVEASSAASSV
jgi:hypothetical protein